jgi:hypothetical protein
MAEIKRRERDAVMNSLQAGLVPRTGLHLIQVGRIRYSSIAQFHDGIMD